jgi:hypothetical protein
MIHLIIHHHYYSLTDIIVTRSLTYRNKPLQTNSQDIDVFIQRITPCQEPFVQGAGVGAQKEVGLLCTVATIFTFHSIIFCDILQL